MRIQRSSFVLNLKILDRSDSTNLKLASHNATLVQHDIVNNLHIIKLLTCLPNNVILECKGIKNNGIELTGIDFVGVPINKELFEKVVEYRLTESFDNILNADAISSHKWTSDGYAIFKLFHHDPFAYHLFIGNKIKII